MAEAQAPKQQQPAAKPVGHAPDADGKQELPRHRERKPFGTQEQRLAVPGRPGFHHRWFNDDPGRVARASAAGYEHVMEDGKPKSMIVGTNRAGDALVAYLMEIPDEWHKEDLAREQAQVDLMDQSIRRGDIAGKQLANDDKGEHFYVGKQGITVRNAGSPQIRRS